ncbi:MAG: arginine--tRNA ligase [Chloroflexi bacterium]|nr:arginine--tRNA ligase [Chloroflexota bacterium]
MTVKDRLSEALLKAAQEAQKQGKLLSVALPDVLIERPQRPEHGDYASTLPLKLARSVGMSPLAIGKTLLHFLPSLPEVQKAEVAPPGFINLTLSPDWLASQVKVILEAGEEVGRCDLGKNEKVQIEFVSVNPTGPLHVGHGRGAILGSTLSNVLAACGFNVVREYYVNDAGTQIEAFHRSIWARYQQLYGREIEMPANGYMGNYMVDAAKEIAEEYGRKFLEMPPEAAVKEIGQIGIRKMIASIRSDLELLGVTFDVWFSEKSLFETGLYEKVMKLLQDRGYVAMKEGAVWFASTALGESKDNVLVRSDGSPTYFASDIAYHYDKFVVRSFKHVIDIWGADHQGHVSRLKTAVSAMGIDAEQLTVIISQMVGLRRGDEVVKVSKRTGELITLKELVEEVGTDACRFFFLSRSADSQMDFDLELAKKQAPENPVYYVQYAHARIASILRLAAERGIDYSQGDVSVLTTAPELALIRKMLALPEVLETVSQGLEPHHLPYYATDLATLFHNFYRDCRVVSDDTCLTAARLQLVKAAQLVLARTLHLMGMTAPDRM